MFNQILFVNRHRRLAVHQNKKPRNYLQGRYSLVVSYQFGYRYTN
jgi:hypothetical protein